MANVKFDVAYDDLYQMIQDYSHLKIDKKHSGPNEIVYIDGSSKDKLVLDGSDLGYTDNVVSTGKINQVHFELSSGKHLIDVTQLHISGSAVHDAFMRKDATALLNLVFGGDDHITGSNGNDYIMGWNGDDVINGGKGNDTVVGFGGNDVINVAQGNDVVYFDHGYGHDKVLNFDADGGDLIWTQSTDYKIVGVHHPHRDDTIIKFNNHDELLLVGVNHHDVTKADFFHI